MPSPPGGSPKQSGRRRSRSEIDDLEWPSGLVVDNALVNALDIKKEDLSEMAERQTSINSATNFSFGGSFDLQLQPLEDAEVLDNSTDSTGLSDPRDLGKAAEGAGRGLETGLTPMMRGWQGVAVGGKKNGDLENFLL